MFKKTPSAPDSVEPPEDDRESRAIERAPDVRPSPPQSNVIPTLVDESAEIVGSGKFKNVQIDGSFRGDIEAEGVIIGRRGSFVGNVTCQTLVVYGLLDGQANCSRIEVLESAVVRADISYRAIRVCRGASITGVVKPKRGRPQKGG
jgi:cytoskeletal protein CcmA (bactofilin family)